MKINRLVLGYLDTNCYILEKGNECIIIDPADNPDEIIKSIGDKKVVGILVTHHHFDHIGALDVLEKKYNLKHNTYPIDNFNFEVIPFPGHTNDLIAFYFKKEKIMFSGDFIFKGSIGRYDFEESSYEDMIDSLNKVSLMDDDIVIYPGHGDKTILKDEKKLFKYFI